MAELIRLRRASRNTTPFGSVAVNWNNPLTTGMTFALLGNCGNGRVNIVNGDVATVTGEEPVTSVTPFGTAVNATAGAAVNNIQFTNTKRIFGNGLFTILYIGAPVSSTTRGSIISQMNGADEISLLINCEQLKFASAGELSLLMNQSGVSRRYALVYNPLDGKRNVFVFSRGDGVIKLYKNGVSLTLGGSSTLFNTCAGTTNEVYALGGSASAEYNTIYPTEMVVVLDGVALNAEQVADLTANPWQLFQATSHRVIFIPDTAGGLSSVYNDGLYRWNVLNNVQNDAVIRWNKLSLAQNDASVRWNLLTPIQQDSVLRWSILHPVSNDSTIRWNLLSQSQTDIVLRWNMLSVAITAQQDATLRWNTLSTTQQDMLTRWNLLTASEQSLLLRWNDLSEVQQTLAPIWHLLAVAQKDAILRWDTLSSVLNAQQDLSIRWDSLSQSEQSLVTRWNITNSIFQSLTTRWNATQSIELNKTIRWNIAEAVAADVLLRWDELANIAVQNDIALRWSISSTAQKDIRIRWTVGETGFLSVIPLTTLLVVMAEDRVIRVMAEDRILKLN